MILWKWSLVFFLSSCQIWGDDESDDRDMLENTSETSASQAESVASGSHKEEVVHEEEDDDELGLTVRALKNQVQTMRMDQSRLWIKIEELEVALRAVREKTHLLQKGLMTGIPPMDLGMQAAKPQDPLMVDDEQMQEVAADPQVVKIRDRQGYAKKYARARQMFQQAEYGKAYLEFTSLQENFDTGVHKDEPLYWIGRCWALLQNYHKAKDSLENYLSQQMDTPWVPAAHLELAKVEMKIGSQEAAVQRLKTMVAKYPYEVSAREAKRILGSLDQAL